jgi:hypothetical protein
MTTDTTASPTYAPAVEAPTPRESTPDERPYPPSWVNRLLDAIERAPGPTWLAYVVIAAFFVVASGIYVAASYENPRPELYATQLFWGVFTPLTMWLMAYLGRVAGDAFDVFRPVMTLTDPELRRQRYELTVLPARAGWIILVVMVVATPAYYAVDPEGSAIIGLSPAGLAARAASEIFFAVLITALIVQSIRQLRSVERIHREATRLDLLRPAPLYAFSILTSRTAIVIALVFLLPMGPALEQGINLLTSVVWATAGVIVAIAVFVLPLRGMQRRIIGEKRRLQSEVGLRLETTMAAIHRAVDEDRIADASAMNDALAALMAERELVEKLPTLPWRPGTLGALVSAIVLPVALFLVQRALTQVFG